jgi:hypothetical protein
MGQNMGKQAFLRATGGLAVLLMTAGNSLFAHEKGDIYLSPEVQIGLEIPNIHQKNEYSEGTYVSLGVDWGTRVTAGYYFLSWLAAGAGIGFGGFHDTNNYNANNSATLRTETYVYDAGYLIIPGGFRVNRGRLAAGAGLAGYIPLFSNSSGDYRARQTAMVGAVSSISSAALAGDDFRIHSFLGGYVDVGYDWAGSKDQSQGFGIYLRGQFPFEDTIAESASGFKNFQHVSLSLILNYCFKIAVPKAAGKAKSSARDRSR